MHYQKTEKGWDEVLLGSTRNTDGLPQDRISASDSLPFKEVLSGLPGLASGLLSHSAERYDRLPLGSRVEISPSAFKIMRTIGEMLRADNTDRQAVRGAALVVDYGDDHAFGNSFRVSFLGRRRPCC